MRVFFGLLAGTLLSAAAQADSTEARCDIYPKGEDRASASIPCQFSQRQGFVTIYRSDGVTHDLEPTEGSGNFVNQAGEAVFRQSGLGDQGLIFRFPTESVFVYWSTAGLEPAESGNPTAPYTTADYDATTILPCGIGKTDGSCPAGILRMDGGEASIVIMSPRKEEFTVNFLSDYVNATGGRQVEAQLDGDLWEIVVNGDEHYKVPLAAIEGG